MNEFQLVKAVSLHNAKPNGVAVTEFVEALYDQQERDQAEAQKWLQESDELIVKHEETWRERRAQPVAYWLIFNDQSGRYIADETGTEIDPPPWNYYRNPREYAFPFSSKEAVVDFMSKLSDETPLARALKEPTPIYAAGFTVEGYRIDEIRLNPR